MKVLITGDREWTDREAIYSWLCKLQDWGYTTVIEGEARGADTIAREEAKEIGLTVIPVPANWTSYGKAAGSIRNSQMLNMNPDLVVAFHPHLIEKSKGTLNMVRQAEKKGTQVILVTGHERIIEP